MIFFDTIKRLHREEDGAIQFYKIKFHLRDHHPQIQNWSDDRWIACLAAGGGSKRRYQYCSDNLGSITYLFALQGHSESNLIDPALQDNVLIGPGIFIYIYHVGSNFNLHSIISNGLILGGQNLSRIQTVFFFLLVDPRNESHKDPEYITVEHQPVGKLVQQSLGEALQLGSSKPTQFPKPIEDRTGQLVTQEIVGKLQEELSSSDRSGQPDREEEKRVLKCHDRTVQLVEERLHKVQEDGYLKNRDDADKFNLSMDDEIIDFNISGIPDATMKRSQSINVHDLIQKIESHPHKEAIQNDLEQHRPFNPFSAESKVAIMAILNYAR